MIEASEAIEVDEFPRVPALERARVRLQVFTGGRTTVSLPNSNLTPDERVAGAALTHPEDAARPKTRAECCDGPRPCPWVSCKFNMYLDVNASGSLVLNYPDKEPDEMEHSCALDLADRDGMTQREVADVMNVTQQGIETLELGTITKVKAALVRIEAGEVVAGPKIKARGCARCGGYVPQDRKTCIDCSAAKSEKMMAARRARQAEGKCQYCGGERASGLLSCDPCREKRNKSR